MLKIISAILAFILSISPIVTDMPTIDKPPETTYIVNTNTDRFHNSDCKHADRIKENNRWEFTGSREELIEFGYVPCKVCDP